MRRLLLVLAVLLVACSSGDDNSSSSETTTTSADSTSPTAGGRPAGEVLEEAGRDPGGHPIKVGEVGGPAIVINDVAVSVVSVGEPYADPDEGGRGGPWIDLEVRAENLGAEETTSPDFLLQCGGENQAFYAASTYDNGSPLPPDSFLEGTIVSDHPDDCESPAIVVEFVLTLDTDPVAHWPL